MKLNNLDKNIFDILPLNFFGPLTRKDRRNNFYLLLKISEFVGDNLMSTTIKEDLVEFLTNYVSDYLDFVIDDEDDQEITTNDSREKVLIKLKQFEKSGWLNIEPGFNVDYVTMDSSALLLIKLLKQIAESDENEVEYTGYIYLIYRLLSDFDFDRSTEILEQVNNNVETLKSKLQTINQRIKKFYVSLVSSKDIEPKDLLEQVLDKYQSLIITNVFENLRVKDNPAKFIYEIDKELQKLDPIDERIIDNYVAKKNRTISRDDARKIIQKIIDNTQTFINQIESIIEIININNNKYLDSAKSVLAFNFSNTKDAEGTINKLLKAIKENQNEEFEFEIDSISSIMNIDDKSRSTPRFNKDKKTKVLLVEEPETEDIKKAREKLLRPIEYSKENVNKFIMSYFKDGDEFQTDNIEIKNMKEFIMFNLSFIYAESKGIEYKVQTDSANLTKFQTYTMNNLIFRRK